MRELRRWPSLAMCESHQGVAFTVRGTEILYPSGHDEMRLRLTAPVISRLGPHLWESGRVHACEDGAWVSVQLEAEADLELLLALTSLAIKAHHDLNAPSRTGRGAV